MGGQVYTNENQAPSKQPTSFTQDNHYDELYLPPSHVAPISEYQHNSGDQSYISLKQINAMARGVDMTSPLQSEFNDPTLNEPFNGGLPVFNEPSMVASPP